jgi:hypothetical protein
MSGISDLSLMLSALSACLDPREFVFCSVPDLRLEQCSAFEPIATCQENEGLSIVVPRDIAEREGLAFEGVFRRISLDVHSSLEAVGLTAALSAALAERGISANIIAGFYHDHILVPAGRADEALAAVEALACA